MGLNVLQAHHAGLPSTLFGKVRPDLSVAIEWVTDGVQLQTSLVETSGKRASWVPRGLGTIGQTLVVWDRKEWPDAESVVGWDELNRRLWLEEDGMSFELEVAQGLNLRTPRSERFWPESLPVAGDRLPDCPVRAEQWDLVRGPSERFSAGNQVGWRVPFVGDVVLTREWQRAHLTELADTSLFAVWPPKIIPGWYCYSILLQGLDFKSAFSPTFWLGEPGEYPGRRLAQSKLLSNNPEQRYVAIEPDEAHAGPRFMAVSDGADMCGVFELLTEAYPHPGQGVSALQVVLDFGTSNTVLATTQGGDVGPRGTAIDMFRHLHYVGGSSQPDDGPSAVELLRPRVIVQGKTTISGPEQPFVPGFVAPTYEERVDKMLQIPSGLFIRGARRDGNAIELSEESLPFVDYTIMGPGLAVEKDFDRSRICWRSGLKWAQTNVETRKFLEGVFTWLIVVARLRSVEIKATFPLAFSPAKRRAYGEVLERAAAAVTKRTGVAVTIAPMPYYGRDPGVAGPLPYVDEASPLILDRFQDFASLDREEGVHIDPKFLFIGDLGGGTLDVLLGYYASSSAFRVVAAESLRIGARDVIDLLLRRLSGGSEATAEFDRALLEGLARQRRLEGIIEESYREGKPFNPDEKLRFEWKNSPAESASQFLGDLSMYYLFILEYASRFVAGTLTQPGLRTRIRDERTPGQGVLGKKSPFLDTQDAVAEFALAVVLTGNGWSFLQLPELDEKRWLHALFDRVEQLADPAAGARGDDASGARKFKVHRVTPEIERSRRKLLTAEKTADILEPAQANNAGARKEVEVAPNGFTDVNLSEDGTKQVHHWGTLVGFAWDSGLNPTQVQPPDQPDFPSKPTPWLTRPSERETYKDWLNRRDPKDERTKVRTRQETVSPRRAVSTARAFWEDVVRTTGLGLPPHKSR